MDDPEVEPCVEPSVEVDWPPLELGVEVEPVGWSVRLPEVDGSVAEEDDPDPDERVYDGYDCDVWCVAPVCP